MGANPFWVRSEVGWVHQCCSLIGHWASLSNQRASNEHSLSTHWASVILHVTDLSMITDLSPFWHLLSEPEPEHPHKSGGSSNRKAPPAREYPVRIGTYIKVTITSWDRNRSFYSCFIHVSFSSQPAFSRFHASPLWSGPKLISTLYFKVEVVYMEWLLLLCHEKYTLSIYCTALTGSIRQTGTLQPRLEPTWCTLSSLIGRVETNWVGTHKFCLCGDITPWQIALPMGKSMPRACRT